MNEQKNYIGYEYKQVTADTQMEGLWKDSMAGFGWTAEKSEPKVIRRLPFALWIMAAPLSLLPGGPFRKQLSDHESGKKVEITFKRDREIHNKTELLRLQQQFEACAHEIEAFERSKTTLASVISVSVGLIGTALLGGAMFAYLGGLLPLMVILAVPSFLGWILPYFCYLKLCHNKAKKVEPLIEQKNEEIYRVCEQGNRLLTA